MTSNQIGNLGYALFFLLTFAAVVTVNYIAGLILADIHRRIRKHHRGRR